MLTIDELMERLTNDEQFRAQVLQDADAALAGYDLSAGDRDRLLQEAEMMEAGVQVNPLQPTDPDNPRKA
jgi:hypothetical protein